MPERIHIENYQVLVRCYGRVERFYYSDRPEQ